MQGLGIHNLVSFLGLFVLLGLAWLVSSRRRRLNFRCVLAGVGPRALLAATLACLMTGAVAGLFFHDAGMVLRPVGGT